MKSSSSISSKTSAETATTTVITNSPATSATSFSFDALPAISRDEMVATRRLREAASALLRKDSSVAAALTDLVGEPVSIVLRRARPLDSSRIPPHALGVLFAPTDSASSSSSSSSSSSPDQEMTRAILVDVESALASTLVTRALRQRAPQVTDASRPLSAEVAGALAALLHATLRRVQADIALRVVAAGPAQVLARDLASACQPQQDHAATRTSLVTAWLTVRVGAPAQAQAFDARVSLALDTIPTAAPQEGVTIDALRAMNDAPIALPLVVDTCLSTRAELVSLRPGDAFILPGFPLRPGQSDDHLAGPVAIVAASSEQGLSGDLAENGRLVLRTERIVNHPWDPRPQAAARARAPMSSSDATLETVLEDAPIVVRVELGTVEMKAREWASLSAGDVVVLGRKLGDPAILRVGGVEVARGELVQVDGEYGVRILKREAP